MYPEAFNVGAALPSVFQVGAIAVQFIVAALPSSTISVIDCPDAHAPAVGVLLAVSVQVWMLPFVGDKAGVDPVTPNTSSV